MTAPAATACTAPSPNEACPWVRRTASTPPTRFPAAIPPRGAAEPWPSGASEGTSAATTATPLTTPTRSPRSRTSAGGRSTISQRRRGSRRTACCEGSREAPRRARRCTARPGASPAMPGAPRRDGPQPPGGVHVGECRPPSATTARRSSQARARRGATVLGTLAGSNRGYLMPMPRTAQQGTHKPMCQQCHEDSRNVGVLSRRATRRRGDVHCGEQRHDLSAAGDNPRFQNFPHETVNPRMTVEVADDLCTNCHPPALLP